jgi:hypothetical protein
MPDSARESEVNVTAAIATHIQALRLRFQGILGINLIFCHKYAFRRV